MKRIIIFPFVGAIAALAIGSAAALSFNAGGVANIAAGSEAVAACGSVNDVSYVTAFNTTSGLYEITSVDVKLNTGHTCVSVAASLLSDASPDVDLGTDATIVADVATFAVAPGFPAAALDDVAVLVQ